MHFARRVSLHPEKIWNLGLIAILSALVGSRLLLVAANFTAFREHPFWVLGLTTIRSQGILFGGVALGIAIAVLYALAENLALLRTFDCIAPALALGITINRIGAFLGGLDYGTTTTQPWGVIYTSRIAALWYGTPLGIRLHPTPLYAAAASAFLFAVSAWWLPRRKHDGDVMGGWLFVYGLIAFFLEFYDGDASAGEVFNGAVALTQALAICAVIAGGIFWMCSTTSGRPPAEMR
jgi:phosphatidylglycerol:prolipoprotein diacylglycerol transferase